MALMQHNVGSNPLNYQPGNWINSSLPTTGPSVGVGSSGGGPTSGSTNVWAFLSPDSNPPVLQNTDPLDLATQVANNKILSLQIVDAEGALDLATVRIYINGGLAYHGGVDTFFAPYTGAGSQRTPVANGFQFDIENTAQWGSFSTVQMQVLASDTAGNLLNALYSFQIEDYASPTILNNTPTGTGVVRTTSVTFETRDVAGAGIDQATLNVTVGGSTAISAGVFQPGWSGTIIANAFLGYDVAINKATDYGSFQNVAVAVSVDDLQGNNAVLNWNFEVEDYLGPLVTPVNPTNAQTGVSVNTNITVDITDEQAVDLNTVTIEVDAGAGLELAFDGAGVPQFKPGWDGAGSQITGSATAYTVVIDKVSPFLPNTAISVKVVADDTAGNPERL